MYNVTNNVLATNWSSAPSYFEFYNDRSSDSEAIDREPEPFVSFYLDNHEDVVCDNDLGTLAVIA